MIHGLARRWSASGLLLATVFLLPLLALVGQSLLPDEAVFAHLLDTVLWDYVSNTVVLVALVVLGSLLIGTPLAWLVAMCRFPGHRLFQWALLLPLAMPAYLVAYVYTDLLDYAGPVQRLLRDVMGYTSPADYYFPEVRSLGGAAIMMALVLFPYVYLLARTAFLEQSVNLVQASRIMGCNAWQSFIRLSLPMVRPALAVGASLVAMETIADFATVNYFAVSTLTTAIYDTWLGLGSLGAAAKLSCVTLLAVFAVIGFERWARRKQKHYQKQDDKPADFAYQLKGWHAWGATGVCTLVLALAFVLPFAVLLDYAIAYFDSSWNSEFFQYSFNSLWMSALVALLCAAIALSLNFVRRISPRPLDSAAPRIASMGYAIPGTVLAIGVLIPLTAMDFAINDLADFLEWQRPGLLLSGGALALILAFTVRFCAIAVGSVENSYKRISPSLDMASISMGCGPAGLFGRVHLPLLRKGVLAGSLLVFIECMKELPAALLLRPIGFENLATYVYQFVSDEMLEQGALPAIVIVIVGLIPIILLNRSLEQANH
ncbi:ABC transporter permease [Paraferrimonas sedimenticola]|uniref:Iron ABC transporter permease n=1 Tax=Paraferrimonas sedimenticola TaxID=375674 RepID=A0AA37W1F3_9GAMM|nr:iron ABC transporter permease [Paraferrimonas sedimenticola]GLP97360.1 iron ABC transporter permease [Paraferrimonas sedimenticola]